MYSVKAIIYYFTNTIPKACRKEVEMAGYCIPGLSFCSAVHRLQEKMK